MPDLAAIGHGRPPEHPAAAIPLAADDAVDGKFDQVIFAIEPRKDELLTAQLPLLLFAKECLYRSALEQVHKARSNEYHAHALLTAFKHPTSLH
jgi:hypothetical protein